jgi:hypothetical protein
MGEIMKPQEMADLLAAWFEVESPKVEITTRRSGACYRPYFRKISISFKGTFRGTEYSMVHEFAHHLAHMRHTEIDSRGNSSRIRPHGSEFMKALLEVAVAWFGSADKYYWSTEYASVRTWYERKVKKS